METPVRVIGLGNVLMGDDGLGPWVIHHLESHYTFPPRVSVLDAGTPGGDLIPYLHGAEVLILVDTVKAQGAPGELRTYRKEDILRHPPQPRVSPHDPGLKEALLTLDFSGGGTEHVYLVGIIPGPIEKTVQLAPAVRAAIPAAAAEVVAELERIGCPPAPRPHPSTDPPWWDVEDIP